MNIIDAHCHLGYILELKTHITPALISGITIDDIPQLVSLREEYPQYKIGFGIHPWFVNKNQENHSYLKVLIKQYKPDFIGEIGLDKLKPDYPLQEKIFIWQLQLAQEFNLPVIIHAVKAYNNVLALLKTYTIKRRGIIHGFNANNIIASQFINHGFLLGIGGLVINKNSTINKNVAKIPLSALVLESDAPFTKLINNNYCVDNINHTNIFLYAQIIAYKHNKNLIDLIKQSNYNVLGLFRN